MCRNPHASTQISAPSEQATLRRNQRPLPARTSPRRKLVIHRMSRQPEQIILRLAPHDTLRQIGLRNEYDAGISQNPDDFGVRGRRVKRSSDVTETGIIALDVELVFQSHGDAVKGTDGAAVGGEEVIELAGTLQSGVEEDFCRVLVSTSL